MYILFPIGPIFIVPPARPAELCWFSSWTKPSTVSMLQYLMCWLALGLLSGSALAASKNINCCPNDCNGHGNSVRSAPYNLACPHPHTLCSRMSCISLIMQLLSKSNETDFLKNLSGVWKMVMAFDKNHVKFKIWKHFETLK